jgi:hypothetical protein
MIHNWDRMDMTRFGEGNWTGLMKQDLERQNWRRIGLYSSGNGLRGQRIMTGMKAKNCIGQDWTE